MASLALPSSTSEHQYTGSARTRRARRWVVKEQRDGWWPFAWLPIIGFILICLLGFVYFAPARIESQVAEQVSRQLIQSGYPWAKVSASGQAVVVRGTPPSPASELQLSALALATECETIFGKLECPTEVRVQLDPPQAAAAALPEPRFFDFRLERQLDSLSLSGEVPSPELEQVLETEAKSQFASVESDLAISSAPSEPGYALAFRRGLSVLSQLESGHANYTRGVLDVEGTTTPEKEADVRRAFSAPADAPALGALRLRVGATATSCDEEFANALEKTSIRFATSRAVIQASSRQVLKGLAIIANRCPGTLRVEGHTDSAGRPEANQKLSLNRANAVKLALARLGVDETRLRTNGLGALRPKASNDTASGRAKNRRIEIHVERSSEASK